MSERTDDTPRTLDTTRTFPSVSTLEEWQDRRERIRTQILVSCGLYPLPARTPLHPLIFGRIERDGYTIEKVAIQTRPGFYLAGNLYRPDLRQRRATPPSAVQESPPDLPQRTRARRRNDFRAC